MPLPNTIEECQTELFRRFPGFAEGLAAAQRQPRPMYVPTPDPTSPVRVEYFDYQTGAPLFREERQCYSLEKAMIGALAYVHQQRQDVWAGLVVRVKVQWERLVPASQRKAEQNGGQA